MDREEAKAVIKKAFGLYQEGNYDEAFPLMLQGADAGFIPAKVLTAQCYRLGTGTKKDEAKALEYYEEAASCREPTALKTLAYFYYTGTCSAQQDYTKAASYLEKYLDKAGEDPVALHMLGRCCFLKEPHEDERGIKLIKRSAELGNAEAQADLEKLPGN